MAASKLGLYILILVTAQSLILGGKETPLLGARELLESWKPQGKRRSLSRTQSKATLPKGTVQLNTQTNVQNSAQTNVQTTAQVKIGGSAPLFQRSIISTNLAVSDSSYRFSETTVYRSKSAPIVKQYSFTSSANMVPVQYASKMSEVDANSFDQIYENLDTPEIKTEAIIIEKKKKYTSQIMSSAMGSKYQEKSYVSVSSSGNLKSGKQSLKSSKSLNLEALDLRSSASLNKVKSGSQHLDILINHEENSRHEEVLKKATFAGSTSEGIDIKNVCEGLQIFNVNKAGEEDKQKITGNVVASTQTWIDIYIAYNYCHSNKIDISSLTKQIVAERKELTSNLNAYINSLNKINKEKLHLFGTNYLGFRVYQTVDYFRGVMGWKATGGEATYSGKIKNFAVEIKNKGFSSSDYESLLTLLRADLKINDNYLKLYEKGYLADSTVMGAWKTYMGTVEGFKLPLCQTVYEVLKLFSGDASYSTLAKAIYDNPVEDVKKQTIGHKIAESKAYWSNFSWLLEKEHRPKGCVDQGKGDNVHEMIQFIKIKKVLTTLNIFKSEKSFFGQLFFEFIKTGDSSPFIKIVDYDWFLICRQIDTTAITNLIKWIPFNINFHWEFFEDLYSVIFQKYGSDLKTPAAVSFSNINYLYVFFEHWKSGGTYVFNGDFEEIEHYSNVLIYIYKLYVIMRSNPESFPIPTPFNSQTFYKQMYLMINQMRDWDDAGNYFGVFFIREHFAIYYPSVLNFICMKIGANFCENLPDDELKQQTDVIKIIVKPDPDPYWIKYFIIIKIRKILEFYRIDIDLKTFEESWLKLDWTLPKCARIERGQVIERQFVIKNNVKVRDETRVKVIVYSKDCTEELYQAWWTLLTGIFKKTWITEQTGFEKFWIVFLRLIEMGEGFKKETVRYLIIRLIRVTFLDTKTDIKVANPILWKIIIRLLELYDNRVTPSLSYPKTAGFYGLFDMILNPMFKLSINKEAYFKISAFDARMLQFDMYFLTMFAAKNTNYRALPEQKLKLWKANVDFMILQFTSLFAQFGAKGTEPKWTDIEGEFAKCRVQKAGIVNQNKFEYRLKEECSSTTSEMFALKDCQYIDNDFADCKSSFALELLNWFLTAKMMIQSVGVYDHFNYFHEYYLPSAETMETKRLHGLMVQDLRDTRLFIASYKHLQMIRGELEMQFNDVRTAVINKIIFCANRDFEPTSDKLLEKQKCFFDSDVYGSLFWIFRHSYIVNFGSTSFTLDPFNPKMPPMATFNYIVLMIKSAHYREEFERVCDESEGTGDYPLICKIKFIVDYWLHKIAEDEKKSDPNSGIAKIESMLNLRKLESRKSYVDTIIGNSKTLMIEKFLFVEAYYCTFHILKANSVRLSALKDDFNYELFKGTGGNSELSKFYEESNVFEFSDSVNVDEFNMFANYLRFTFSQRNLFAKDLDLANVIRGILKETKIETDFKISSGKDTAIIDLLSKFCGAQQSTVYAMFLRYSTTQEDYQKLVGLFYSRKIFLDVVTTEISEDVYERVITMLEDPNCGGGNKGKCFVQFVQQHNLETKGYWEFQIGADSNSEQEGYQQPSAFDEDPFAVPKELNQIITKGSLGTTNSEKQIEMQFEKITIQTTAVEYQGYVIGDIDITGLNIDLKDAFGKDPYQQETFSLNDQRSNAKSIYEVSMTGEEQILPNQETDVFGANVDGFEFSIHDLEQNSEPTEFNLGSEKVNSNVLGTNFQAKTSNIQINYSITQSVTGLESVSSSKRKFSLNGELSKEISQLGGSPTSKSFNRYEVTKTSGTAMSKGFAKDSNDALKKEIGKFSRL